MENNNYVQPEMEINTFSSHDVIVTSNKDFELPVDPA